MYTLSDIQLGSQSSRSLVFDLCKGSSISDLGVFLVS